LKSYHQFCGVAKALDVVGERWTLLIVRDLLLGPRRYGDLLASLEGITTNLLAKRLRDLEAHGVVERRALPAPAGSRVYALTALGRSLQPAILALGAFGARFMSAPDPDEKLSPRWAMVSLMRRCRGAAEPVTIGLEIGDLRYQGRLDADGLVMRDGAPPSPDVTVRGPVQAHVQWISGRCAITDLVRDGSLQRDGSARALRAFERSLR
jgi:DNA-binding HxlR family transcriptional regulator